MKLETRSLVVWAMHFQVASRVLHMRVLIDMQCGSEGALLPSSLPTPTTTSIQAATFGSNDGYKAFTPT